MLSHGKSRSVVAYAAQMLTKALFTRREGYPSKRVTLARTHLFLFSSSCLQGGQGYPGRRVTLSAC